MTTNTTETSIPPAWTAAFISGSTPENEGDPASYFRRAFTVDADLQEATLHVTGLGIVEPYVNGTRVGDQVLAPGWTSYQHRLMITSHDITAQLHPGGNAFGAIVGEGWAVGTLGWDGARHHYADRPALFAELHLRYPDRIQVIGTDDTFRTGTGAVRANGIYFGETYDARLEPDGWATAAFDDTGWEPASLFPWNLDTLEASTAPPIRRIQEIAPTAILTSPAGRTIVDFGQNVSGWVRLTVTGIAGDTIVLRHAELLTPDGEPEFETNRTAEATDRYILRGGEAEIFEPRFTFHGFRYVQVEGWPGTLSDEDLTAVVVHTDMTRTGWLETSEPLLNRLHENTVWSMRDNFVGVPTDCPQRDERLGWTGDLNAFAPTGVFLYDVRDTLTSWLQDLAAEQADTGQVPMVVPDVLRTGSTPTALWGDVAISLPWLLYQEYGDKAILAASYPSMTQFMDNVEAALDENGLWSRGFQYGDWLDPDAPADNPAGGKTDAHLVASAYLCKTTRELAATADVLGTDDAARYHALAQRVRDAFRHEYVSPAGRVTNESATAYALALMFGILDPDQEQKAGDRLADIIAGNGYTIATGFAGTPLLPDALSRTGHLADAYALLLQQKMPSFLYPVTMGATTIWERWDAVLPDGTLNSTGMTSLNHYALGAVADWMHRVIGGLERLEPGWRRIRVAPQPGGDLTHARAAHDTALGRAEVDWRIIDDTMHLIVTIPEGARADVQLPLHPDRLTEEVGAGTHAWDYPILTSAEVLTLDTPIKDLLRHNETWTAVLDVLRRYYPGVPIEAGIEHMKEMTLRQAAARIPDNLEAALLDLQSALRN
jgi:alpha-L-rhamnosidase